MNAPPTLSTEDAQSAVSTLSSQWPSVSAVVATRDRPELLKRSVVSMVEQDYPGRIQVVVVFDRSEPHPVGVDLGDRADREIVTIRNTRTPGLAGGRNSGIAVADGELIAFNDDDDVWRPQKLRRQVELLHRCPDATIVATGVRIVTAEGNHVRQAPNRVTFEHLLRSRESSIPSSSFLIRRADFAGRIGPVDEDLPGSFGEDYEFMLRATRHGDLVAVPDPLVDIDWARPSFFDGRWDVITSGLSYILERVPEFANERRGRARIEGQIAFAHAARRRRRQAIRWASRAFLHDPRQLRAYGALAVMTGLVSPQRLVEAVQERGRGL